MRRFIFATVAAALSIPTPAFSANTLLLDVNLLTGQFVGAMPFGLMATGTVFLSTNSSSVLSALYDNGSFVAPLSPLASFSGRFDLITGQVVGGRFDIACADGSSYGCDIDTTCYTGSVTPQLGGQSFDLDGLVNNAIFSGPLFSGHDVSPWQAIQPVWGDVLFFAFNPNSAGFDPHCDINIDVTDESPCGPVTPLPSAAAAGAGGLALVCASRKRRRFR